MPGSPLHPPRATAPAVWLRLAAALALAAGAHGLAATPLFGSLRRAGSDALVAAAARRPPPLAPGILDAALMAIEPLLAPHKTLQSPIKTTP